MRVWMSYWSISHIIDTDTVSITLSGKQKIWENTKYIMEHFRDEVGDIVCLLVIDWKVVSTWKWNAELRRNDSPTEWTTEHIIWVFNLNDKMKKLLWSE